MRLRRRAIASLAGLLVLGFPFAVSAAVSPAVLLSSALQAGRAQHSVHYVSKARLGDNRVTEVGDVGGGQGIQRIAYSKGNRNGRATVIVSGNAVYVRADAFTLVNFMGFKPAAAVTYGGAWVLIPSTDADFSTVARDVTLSSAIGDLTLS